MATSLLAFLILILLFSLSSFAISPSDTVLKAAETLSDFGHLSMALTLPLVSQTILSQSPTTTMFAPSDAAFIQSGQPSLNQLQYHISPLRFSIVNLKALPYGTAIPTFLSNHSLIITSSASDAQLSINSVKINEIAIYDDDRSLIIYGIDEFFNSSFQISPYPAPVPSPSSSTEHNVPIITEPPGFDVDYYARASDLLRSRGYTRIATFLDMQLVGFMNRTKLTIFAPIDDEIDEYAKNNFSDYSLAFRRHVVPNWLTWRDFLRVDDGTMLETFSEGFTIEVTRSGDVLELNGVPVIFPDLYYSDWLVVHGLHQLLVWQPQQEHIGDSFSELDGDGDQTPPDYDKDYQP